jgi:hypothetical protein
MPEPLLTDLLPALEIAAFVRSADGAFSTASPMPAWFASLVKDTSFPFLGHVLEEAQQFWGGGSQGFQEFGPCAEVDESGREFHYKVIAVSARSGQYLLFQLDPATDQMRDVLQKARERTLRAGESSRTGAALALLQNEARATAVEIAELTGQLRRARPHPEAAVILDDIAARCERLRNCVTSVTALASTRE